MEAVQIWMAFFIEHKSKGRLLRRAIRVLADFYLLRLGCF